jgi:nucleoside-specific outer membrane channel protein Tsx
MKKSVLTILGLAALATLPAAAADWSDTYLGYRTGNNFREPGIEASIQKQIITLDHVSGNSLGSNFFNVDMLKSDSNDPINNAAAASPKGAQEVYVAYRNNLSFSKMTKSKVAFGPVTDVEWTTGFDWNSKNTEFAPSVYKLILGPTLSFKVPGFLTVGLQYYKEWNHNSFGGFNGGNNNVVFDGTYQVNVAWGINAPIGPVPGKFKGFAAFTGPKGKDGSTVQTKLETLIDAYWMADISSLLGAKKGTWQLGPGVEYWNNKFGDPTFSKYADVNVAHAVANPRTLTTMVSIEYHF